MTKEERALLDTTLGVALAALEVAGSAIMTLGSAMPPLIPMFLESLDHATLRTEADLNRNQTSAAGVTIAVDRLQGLQDELKKLQALAAARPDLSSPIP